MRETIGHLRDRLGKVLGIAVLINLLLAVAMAASPSLHLQVHHDADHEDHECVVTHLLDGDFSDGVPAAPVCVSAPEWSGFAEALPWAAQDDVADLWLTNGVLEHGPPVVG